MSTKGNTSKTVSTKTPSSNKEQRCPMCSKAFESNEKWMAHVLGCAKEKANELKFPCCIEGSAYISKREHDLKRHMDTKHNTLKDSLETGKDSANFHGSSSTTPSTSIRGDEDHLPENNSPKKRKPSFSSTSHSKTSEPGKKGVQTEERKAKRKRKVHHSVKKFVSFMQDGKHVEETETKSWDSEED